MFGFQEALINMEHQTVYPVSIHSNTLIHNNYIIIGTISNQFLPPIINYVSKKGGISEEIYVSLSFFFKFKI